MRATTDLQTFRSLAKPTAAAAVIAVVVVLVIHVVGSSLFDASMEVTIGEETQALGAGLAAGFTAVIAVLGGVAGGVLARVVRQPELTNTQPRYTTPAYTGTPDPTRRPAGIDAARLADQIVDALASAPPALITAAQLLK